MSKITRAKKDGGMAQVVEHLPSKCTNLSSNPSTKERKKESKILIWLKDTH
jgi:hypothetical protein